MNRHLHGRAGSALGLQQLQQLPLNAFAILDGGGVKAAALVGCLRAADERGIRFAGYGGTSAGSLIAFLAAIGTTPDAMQHLVVSTAFDKTFFPDGGAALLDARRIVQECGAACNGVLAGVSTTMHWRNWAKAGWQLYKQRALFLELWTLWQQIDQQMGLYDGSALETWVEARCQDRFPNLRGRRQITLNELANEDGVLPLKIVASNLHARAPQVFAAHGPFGDTPITTALRSSMSYPLLFQPVPVGERRFMVDGGLSSNLPMFLFEEERRKTSLPIFAFDLVAAPGPFRTQYRVRHLLQDMLETALEGGESIQRGILRDLYHVRILVPEGIDTLDFDLSADKRRTLELTGHSFTSSYLTRTFAQAQDARTAIEQYHSIYARPDLVRPVLQAIVTQFEMLSLQRSTAYGVTDGYVRTDRPPVPTIRVNVMLHTGHGTRLVVYQQGMDNDPDRDMEMGENAGITGLAWRDGKGAFGEHSPDPTRWGRWGFSGEEARIRPDRRAIFAVPIRAFGYDQQTAQDLPKIGTLAVDSDWTLAESGWQDQHFILGQRLVEWADVLASILRS